jgi:hypothetical protein
MLNFPLLHPLSHLSFLLLRLVKDLKQVPRLIKKEETEGEEEEETEKD